MVPSTSTFILLLWKVGHSHFQVACLLEMPHIPRLIVRGPIKIHQTAQSDPAGREANHGFMLPDIATFSRLHRVDTGEPCGK